MKFPGPGARVVRGAKREFISRCYNLILRGTLAAGFSDAQCGFKAIRSDVARRLLPLVEDTGWFFDTELLILAERAGLRIHEVPVDWVDDSDSRVDIVATAIADLKGIARLGRALTTGKLPIHQLRAQLSREQWRPGDRDPAAPAEMLGQVVRFAAIGAVSTLAYLVFYVVARGMTGALTANLLALLVTAVANTAANRRFTFGVRGRDGAAVHQFQGLIVFTVGLTLTTAALGALGAWAPTAGHAVELLVLVAANLLATVVRFVLFRSWVFRRPPFASAHSPAKEISA